MRKIYSLQNTKIKNLIRINKKNYANEFIVEGVKEFKMAIKGNFFPRKIFICENIFHNYNMIKTYYSITFFISLMIFKKLAYRENSGGIIALFREKKIKNQLRYEKIINNSLILILDGIEKPGNIGSMLRIADAAGIHFVILCNMKTHIYNPNVIRCSLGSIFTRKIFIEKMESVFFWLKKNEVKIVSTGFYNHKNAKNLYKTQLKYSKLAIVFGSENKGISDFWLERSKKIITIPMFGKVDSLNVSHAMTIIIYEIIRQKNY
ncbi:TrmH family RNA methyltransferase [Blattabacterium cuenoti]|uniref:TrmH family RNA methyltransferase n=1 Tax=Blattabacterium cuenoti TaxID=1653831 RepID=UPI00163C58A7|nr:TrmH family RNA methyltransferase [Blattabacterium cuenoti]